MTQEATAGTEVTWQSPVILIQANQAQAMRAEDVAEDVVPKDAVTKDVADRIETSTDPYTHYNQ